MIIRAPWPEASAFARDESAEDDFDRMREAVSAVRNVRSQMNVPPSREVRVLVRTDDPETARVLERTREMASRLARVSDWACGPDLEKPSGSASAVIKGGTVFVPLEGIIDLEVERGRLAKENARLAGLIQGTEKKLSNENFVQRAKPEVVEREREKLESLRGDLEKVVAARRDLE